MSSAKFASITAGLLARKGEAQPWPALSADDESLPPLAWRPAPATPPAPAESKDKSCALRMSSHDYERLGILAVKTGVTRQQLLKQALSEFLAARAAQYGCACLGACNNNCGQAG
jgi:hypothetical protein